MRDVKCNLIRDVHTCIPHDLNQKRYVKQGKSLGNGKMKGEKMVQLLFQANLASQGNLPADGNKS